MAFWSDKDTSEPLRQNRWYIEFDNLKNFRYALKTCSKPEYDIGVSEHVLLNHTFRYPKNLVWKPISIVMIAATVNPIEFNREAGITSLSEKLYQMLYMSGYKPPHEEMDETDKIYHRTNISKASLTTSFIKTPPEGNFNTNNNANAASRQPLAPSGVTGEILKLIQIDSNGNAIEVWELYNPFISNVKFGALSYDNDNFVDINLNIAYDYAKVYANPSYDYGLERQTINIFGLDTNIINPFSFSSADRRRINEISPGFPVPQ